MAESAGIPLSFSLTGGHRNDVTEPEPLIEAIPPVRGRRGRPRQRPNELYDDRAYNHEGYRDQVRAKGIRPRIARLPTDADTDLFAPSRVRRWYE